MKNLIRIVLLILAISLVGSTEVADIDIRNGIIQFLANYKPINAANVSEWKVPDLPDSLSEVFRSLTGIGISDVLNWIIGALTANIDELDLFGTSPKSYSPNPYSFRKCNIYSPCWLKPVVSVALYDSRTKNYTHRCVGAIIRQDMVLTASSCIEDVLDKTQLRFISVNLPLYEDKERSRMSKKQIQKYSQAWTQLILSITLIQMIGCFLFDDFVGSAKLPTTTLHNTVFEIAPFYCMRPMNETAIQKQMLYHMKRIEVVLLNTVECAKYRGNELLQHENEHANVEGQIGECYRPLKTTTFPYTNFLGSPVFFISPEGLVIFAMIVRMSQCPKSYFTSKRLTNDAIDWMKKTIANAPVIGNRNYDED